LIGSTFSELGAAPKLHWSMAPIQTCIAIEGSFGHELQCQ
jgi:hypothetical protein